MTRNNMYVFAIAPEDLLADAAVSWDSLDFGGPIASRRAGRAAWRPREAHTIFGFALWWDCTLAPGVVLSTSPHAPRTHWDQIYLPLLRPVAAQAGDELALTLESETGGDESRDRGPLDGRPCAGRALARRAGAVDRGRLAGLRRRVALIQHRSVTEFHVIRSC